MYKVEKNIEMPNPIHCGVPYYKYPFTELQIGDSFAVPVDPTTKLNYIQVAKRVQNALQAAKRRWPDTVYAIRTMKHEKCVRVWRTK